MSEEKPITDDEFMKLTEDAFPDAVAEWDALGEPESIAPVVVRSSESKLPPSKPRKMPSKESAQAAPLGGIDPEVEALKDQLKRALEALAAASKSANAKPEPVKIDLEKLQEDALKSGGERAALLRSGATAEEIDSASVIKQWIYNSEIGNISPRVGEFLPRAQEGMFLYTPAFPVTDENKKDHILLCEQRINTQRIDPLKGTKFDVEAVNAGLMARAQPMSVDQAKNALGTDYLGAV
jgi:hypothetical protein